MRDCTIFTLPNGIRVVHQFVSTSKIVHSGIVLGIGSRDETIDNQGIAHFWEHMAFKGTKRRTTLDILNSLDSIGGELNAYTDKEKIVFYASVLNEYFERSVDVLSDIAFHSVFPEEQLKKERGVVLEEMAMYQDDPEDSLQDEFEAVIFRNHPMGMNILGREETIKTLQRKDFKKFYKENVDSRRVIFSCVGNITLAEVEKFAHKYLGKLPAMKSQARRKKITVYKPQHIVLHRPVKQSKCAIGRDGYARHHESRIPFYMLVNILGGPGMNSRLSLELREKYGFVYSIDAQYTSYSDTGMFAIFFGTEPKQLQRCIDLIKKQLAKFRDKPLSAKELKAAKEQIRGQMAMSEENNLSLMLMMGRSVLDFGRVPTLEEVFDKIQKTTSLTLQEVANEMFAEEKLSTLIMQS